MSYQKKLRIKDKSILKEVGELGCYIKNCRNKSYAHHRKTKGSGGDDTVENLIPLCNFHHAEIHTVGEVKFFSTYSINSGSIISEIKLKLERLRWRKQNTLI